MRSEDFYGARLAPKDDAGIPRLLVSEVWANRAVNEVEKYWPLETGAWNFQIELPPNGDEKRWTYLLVGQRIPTKYEIKRDGALVVIGTDDEMHSWREPACNWWVESNSWITARGGFEWKGQRWDEEDIEKGLVQLGKHHSHPDSGIPRMHYSPLDSQTADKGMALDKRDYLFPISWVRSDTLDDRIFNRRRPMVYSLQYDCVETVFYWRRPGDEITYMLEPTVVPKGQAPEFPAIPWILDPEIDLYEQEVEALAEIGWSMEAIVFSKRVAQGLLSKIWFGLSRTESGRYMDSGTELFVGTDHNYSPGAGISVSMRKPVNSDCPNINVPLETRESIAQTIYDSEPFINGISGMLKGEPNG